MKRGRMQVAARVGIVGLIFTLGFMCGSLTQRPAEAQLEDLGKAALQAAGESGGAVGSAVELGNAIVEMQDHVDGLQKNIDVLKKVKASLGG